MGTKKKTPVILKNSNPEGKVRIVSDRSIYLMVPQGGRGVTCPLWGTRGQRKGTESTQVK